MSGMPEFTQRRSVREDATVRIAFIICAGGMLIFLLWSIFAQLDEGVTVNGQIVADDDRKVVQHLEGGIVKAIHVRDGDQVKKGQILVELEELAANAGREEVAQELAVQMASLARTEALLNGRPAPDFSALDDLNLSEDALSSVKKEQIDLFRQQAAAHAGQVSVLARRATSLRGQQGSIPAQIAALRRSRDTTQKELDHIRPLLDEKLVTAQRVSSLERELARVDAEIARLEADRRRFGGNAYEVSAQVGEARASFRRELANELLESRRAMLALRERLDTASDVLTRQQLVAPQDGEVLNLAITTRGAVLSAGDPVMEIVPPNQDLIAEVQIAPADRDSIYRGMEVEAQLSAYKDWQAPRLRGEVLSVSADLKKDNATGLVFYSARIRLKPKDDGDFTDIRLAPGMPVDAFVLSGETRSFMSYMLEPITASVRRGLGMT